MMFIFPEIGRNKIIYVCIMKNVQIRTQISYQPTEIPYKCSNKCSNKLTHKKSPKFSNKFTHKKYIISFQIRNNIS